MSIDYLSEIKPLEGELSDAQIASHLNAKTSGAMQPEPSAYILSDSGAVLSSPADGSRFGSLIDHYEVADEDAKNLIAFFIERILDNKQEVHTNEYPRSIQFQSVCASFPADLQSVCDQLVEFAGGRPHSGVTEADVAQSRTDWEQAEADRIAEEEAKAEAERIAREEKKAEEERQRQIDEQLNANDQQFWSLYNENIAVLKDNREVDGWQAAIQAMADGWVE